MYRSPSRTLIATVLLLASTLAAQAQQRGRRPAEILVDRFDRSAPQIGDLLPDLTAWDPTGKAVPLRSLKGQYTVLVFGCLT